MLIDDIYWKNFEGVAKASYSFKCEELLRQLEQNEEQGINIVGLRIDYAARCVELIIEASADDAKKVLQNGVEIDEMDDIEIIDLTGKM